MFSRKKIAAVSGLLGGLAMTCTSGTQAYAAGPQGACAVNNQGNTTCIQRTVRTPEGDEFVVRQESCVPVQPLSLPVIGILNKGKKRIGPEVTCSSNTTPAPDNSDNSLGLPGLLG